MKKQYALAGFELRQMPLGNIRFVRHHLPRHPAAISYLANALAQEEKEVAIRRRSYPL